MTIGKGKAPTRSESTR